MKSSEIELQIATLQEKERQHKERLGALVQSIRTELAPQAESWIREQVRQQVEINSAAIVALGSDRVKALKEAVNTLCSSLPKVIEEETSKSQAWPHNRTTVPNPPGEDFFSETFRNVVSHLGPVLAEFGILNPKEGSHPSWGTDYAGKIEYRIFITFNRGLAITQYQTTEAELRKIQRQLVEANAALISAKAREMWDAT